VNAGADLVTLVQRLPRVLLHLLHAETDTSRLRIDAQNFDLDRVAGIDDFARVFDALGPAHLGNVDQSFNARLEFHERTVISDAGDASRHSRADRETFLHTRPRIRQELFITERHALAFAIKLQHLHLDRVADFEQLVWILEPAPGHVSHMQQTIDPAEIDERAVVREVLDLTFNDDVFFDLLESLVFAAGVLLFNYGLARQDDVRTFAIELDDFCFDYLVTEAVEIPHRPHVDLRTRQKRGDAVDINTQPALDAINHAALHIGPFTIGFLEVVPRLHAHGVRARQHREAVGGFHALDQDFDFVTGFDGELAVFGKLGGIHNPFRLVAEIDYDAAFAESDDGAAHDFTFFESRLLLFELIEELSEVDVATCARLFGVIDVCLGCGSGLRSHYRSLRLRLCLAGCCLIVGLAVVQLGLFTRHAHSCSSR
jgi:hypothetical protein